ncbi:MAG: VWA domain-containing protein [Thermoanaerobaculia bacterium]|nr:VWA domain-containing protein [Thermoanaerobaculia bacterium]
MRRSAAARRTLLSVALATLACLPASAQDPGPLPGIFGEVLDVRVVNLEVVVTDRDGLAVRGLGPADFVLRVDGEPVPIDYFSEVQGGVAVARDGGGQVPEIGELAPGEPVGTSYLFFIDDFFSVPNDRNRVIDGVIEDLGLLGPEDRMAVVAYDGDRLEMLSTWSQSREELARVLKNARLRPSYGLRRAVERRQLNIDDAASIGSLLGDGVQSRPTVRTQLTPEERFYVQQLSEQLDRIVAAASATLRSFAKPPGRKVMLLMSGGWPYLPTDFLLQDFERVILDREGLEGDDLYRRLVDTANLLGYTLYPVDAPGLDRDLADAALLNPRTGTGAADRMIREQELHYTLQYLAEETGGRALLNAGRDDAFAAAVGDTRSYYWIGFTPRRAWDDRRHRVEVEMASQAYRVRSREGFLDSSRGREVTMAVESALLFGNTVGQGQIGVTLGEPRKAGRRRMEVPIEVLIPLDQVTVVPVGEKWASQLELRIAVRDEEGRRAEIPVVPLELEASGPPEPGQYGRYQTKLRLRRMAHEAVVAVYDPASGSILSSGVEILP